MSIRMKIVGLAITPIVGMAIMLVVGWSGMHRTNDAMQTLVREDFTGLLDEDVPKLVDLYASIELMLNADRDAYQALTAEYNALNVTSTDQYTAAAEDHATNLAQVKERMELASASLDPSMRPIYNDAIAAYEVWATETTGAVNEAQRAMSRAKLMGSSHERVEKFQAMRDLIDQLQISQEERIAASRAKMEDDKQAAMATAETETQRASATVITFLAAAGIAGALVIALCCIVALSITRPMSKIIERMRDIAEGEGDLTQRVDEKRRDELGEIGKWFNRFVQKIHDVIISVDQAAMDVAGASTELSASTEEMAATMDEQSRQVQEISGSVEQLSASVIEIAQQSSDAASQANQAGDTARSGGEVVRNTVTGMKSIADAVSASSRSVQELGKRGEQIGEVITVINDIADQTNLLALNAAIEAARAGEHGRGFAVVADEVRKLADRTTKATEEIAESIRAIQTETGEAVRRMDAGTEEVTQGVEQATQAGQSLEEIVSAAGQVATLIQTIASSTERQSASSEQIGRAIEQIAAASAEAAQGAGQSASAVNSLSLKAEQLQAIVKQFKIEPGMVAK